MSGAITAAVVVAGGAMVAANQAEITGRAALSVQQEMQKEGMTQEERMLEKAREDRAPWLEAGRDIGLAGLTDMADPSKRGQMYSDYYDSPEFVAQQQQAAQTVGRTQSAHGGLRGGSTYSQLENIAPQLGANYMADKQNQYTNLANMGMGMAGQNAAGFQQIGVDQMNMFNQMGANQANQKIAAANTRNQAMSSGLAGIGMAANDYFNPQQRRIV